MENPDKEEDRIHLHEKIAAGHNSSFLNFSWITFISCVERLAIYEGVTLPLIAGILPPTNWHSLQSMSAMCGVSIPKQLAQDLIKQEDDPEVCREIGFDHVERQLEELLSEGVEGVHLYALNRLETVERLGPHSSRRHQGNPECSHCMIFTFLFDCNFSFPAETEEFSPFFIPIHFEP
ncbi:MAG: hypothetical protein Ct9H300mP28_37680 [Pseudomonadota bacterium]|nr:MAG: hypothetical protein Ct9H300mP28_37680 [Pseudomonadota bacterium]